MDPATKAVTDIDQIVGNATADGSAPHADSRSITFVWTNKAQGGTRTYDLVETDDGGINKLTNSQTTSQASNKGKWSSLTGTGLGVAEHAGTVEIRVEIRFAAQAAEEFFGGIGERRSGAVGGEFVEGADGDGSG